MSLYTFNDFNNFITLFFNFENDICKRVVAAFI